MPLRLSRFSWNERSLASVISVMEPEALGRLFDRHAAALVLYARQWCAAAEDVVQEALLKLAGKKPPDQEDWTPWLYRVVRNAAIDAARAESRRQRHEGEAARQVT